MWQGIVYLVGFSGCGKSTVGPRLARQLNCMFVDTDDLIRKRCRKSIAAIFKEDGERRFRAEEREVIASLALEMKGPAVIALGGGALLDAGARDLVMRSGLLAYLSCSARELCRRLRGQTDRPLLVPASRGALPGQDALLLRIKSLLSRREKHYRAAHLRVSTTRKDPAEVTRQLRRKLKEYCAKSQR